MKDYAHLPYRPAAAVMLLNAENKVWVGQRIDSTLAAWQMPQGGLDEGETPMAGALRELEEETGISSHLVDIIAAAPEPKYYDLPEELLGKLWKGRYRGQSQHWFLARFLGADADVKLETAEPEFRAWRWVDAEQVPLLIVPFKQALYQSVLDDFLPLFP